MSLYSQTYNQLPLITAPKIDTDLLWDLSFLFIGLAVVYFMFVFFYRNLLSKRSWQVKERKKELSPMISEFLFYEENASKDEKSNYIGLKIEIRQLLKDDFNRKVLSEVLLDLRKDVAGDTQKQLFKLYQDLGLHNDEFKKLRSWRWQIVSKAILNLTQMQVAEAYSFVTKFINDKRHTIRKQAEIAVVTLKPEGINYFLDTTKHKISEWQQLKLMDVLRNNSDYQPPRFKAWLTSSNRHVVLFALRLMKYYNQNDADAALIELVKHKSNQIKEEAIGCIKEFRIVEALPTLKLVFWKSSVDVKISILSAIGALGNETDIEFLELIEKKEANFSVRSKAHSSINAIAPGSIMPSKGVVDSSKYTIPEDIEIEEEVDDDLNLDKYTASLISEEFSASIEAPNETGAEIKWDFPNKTNDQPEEIINNVEKHDVMEESQEQEEKENTKPAIKEIESVENESLCFDFLPVVVQEDESLESEIIEEKEAAIELHGIVVNYEEVAEKLTEEKKPTLEITPEEIAFLPIVTELIDEPIEKSLAEQQSENSFPISAIEVQFETVVPIEELEVEFDTVVSVNEFEIETEKIIHNIPTQELEFTSDYSKYKTLEIFETPVIYDEINVSFTETTQESDNWPLLEFGNEFIDTSNMFEMNDENISDDVFEEIMETPSVVNLAIPKAVLNEDVIDDIIEYKENTEESRMQLLDDLEAMGDERELPLLEELLVNEKYATVKVRVKKLIEKFSETEKRPDAEPMLKPFNVFEDLFRTCDTEAKLILMDEIVGVGDESDIGFLEELLEDEDPKISNKAAQVLEELKAILSMAEAPQIETPSPEMELAEISEANILKEEKTLAAYDSLMEELQIAPPQESEIFDLNFELTNPLDHSSEELSTKKKSSDSFFGQIWAMSGKIIDRFNG